MLLYVISFIVGCFITIILYGKVPTIVLLIIASMVGWAIGYFYNKIQKNKAEREYVERLIANRALNQYYKDT